MNRNPHGSSATPASRKTPWRLFWLPVLLAVLPWLGCFFLKAHRGLEGLAALSGASPGPGLEWLGLGYLAAQFASTLISPGLLIGAIILWFWEESNRRAAKA